MRDDAANDVPVRRAPRKPNLAVVVNLIAEAVSTRVESSRCVWGAIVDGGHGARTDRI